MFKLPSQNAALLVSSDFELLDFLEELLGSGEPATSDLPEQFRKAGGVDFGMGYVMFQFAAPDPDIVNMQRQAAEEAVASEGLYTVDLTTYRLPLPTVFQVAREANLSLSLVAVLRRQPEESGGASG